MKLEVDAAVHVIDAECFRGIYLAAGTCGVTPITRRE